MSTGAKVPSPGTSFWLRRPAGASGLAPEKGGIVNLLGPRAPSQYKKKGGP